MLLESRGGLAGRKRNGLTVSSFGGGGGGGERFKRFIR